MHTPPPVSSGPKASKWYAATLAIATASFAVDQAWQKAAITPLIGICWIMAVSSACDRRVLVRTALIFFFFVVASLTSQDTGRLVVRSMSYTAGCIIAYLYAGARINTLRLLGQMKEIISKAPVALVAADHMGCIISASEELRTLMGEDYRNLEGQSFPDMVMCGIPPGEAMRQYIELFSRSGERDFRFSLRGRLGTSFEGRVNCCGEGKHRMLIASIHDPR